jgi:retron-type reverse transcriptase
VFIKPVGGGQINGVVHKIIPELSFNDILSIKALFSAWRKFSKGKRARADIQIYQKELRDNIEKLQNELLIGTYRHEPYQPFTIFDPKQRSIHKATVRDRLVHQAIVSGIEPLFEKQFIYDSFSCRVGKGTHAAVKRLQVFLRRASVNNTRNVYVLKCDVSKFFDSVDHQILNRLINRRVKDDQTRRLIKEVIDSFCTQKGKGIPLGNVTSQLFANIYLHELDRFVKHNLLEKYYLRYCDDFVIVARTREHLLSLIPRIENFLTDNLALKIHPHKVEVRSWRQGVDFVGYVLKPSCILIRTKTKKRILERVNERNISSYLGICNHANAYQLEGLIKTISFTNQP